MSRTCGDIFLSLKLKIGSANTSLFVESISSRSFSSFNRPINSETVSFEKIFEPSNVSSFNSYSVPKVDPHRFNQFDDKNRNSHFQFNHCRSKIFIQLVKLFNETGENRSLSRLVERKRFFTFVIEDFSMRTTVCCPRKPKQSASIRFQGSLYFELNKTITCSRWLFFFC